MTAGIRGAGLLGMLFLMGALPLEATKTPPAHPVNLNTATVQDLMTLPGIGQTRAEAIFDFRRKNGQFHSVNDLLVVHGISKKRLDLIRPYITVGPPPPPHSQPTKPKPKAAPKPSPPKPASPAAFSSRPLSKPNGAPAPNPQQAPPPASAQLLRIPTSDP
jgi:competence ComEA-like helix-hairpin-helix protein